MGSNKVTIHVESEVKAYVHQIVEDFTLFMSQSTELIVEEKKPKKVIKMLQERGELGDDFTAKYCYSISLKDGSQKLVNYGLSNDPYSALKEAKDKLLKQLGEFYEEVVSSKDRINEINALKDSGSLKH